MRATICCLVLVLAGATTLPAQAPRITPAGDPSIKNDTIYSLAVDPADHADDDVVFLLDDGVVRVERDGRGSRTYRQVVQILTRDAAERLGEQSFSYDGGRERFTLNWVRVLRLSGEVISSRPSHEQESAAPVAASAPVYSDVKVHQVTLAGVEPGTLVDYSYTIETLQPTMPGDVLNTWRVTTGPLTRRSRYIVDAPADMLLRIKEENLDFGRRTTDVKGRRIYEWTAGEIPKVDPEPFAADSNGIMQTVTIAAPIAWADVARWYAGLARDRYKVSPALDSELARVVAPSRTPEDSLRLLHRWVAQDFRYVSLALGIGGYRPRLPDSVFAAKYGDCKDKATLFIAAAGRLGIHAYPVVLRAGGPVDRGLPSSAAFNHMIAAVERRPGYTYVDLTADLVPFGMLPMDDQGAFGLLIHPDGRAEEVTIPEDSLAANREVLTLTGEVTPDGGLHARVVSSASGSEEAGMRSTLAEQRSEADLRRLAQGMATALLPGATGDSLEAFDGRDLQAQARVALVVHQDHALTRSGDREVLTLPLPNVAGSGLAAALASDRRRRRFPIDVAKIFGPRLTTQELRLTLPVGWSADLPPSLKVASDFGTYEADYTQEGRELHVVRRLRGAKGIEPPYRIDDLITWLRDWEKDDVRYVVLRHS